MGETDKHNPAIGPDGFEMDESSPHFNCHCLINEFLGALPKPIRVSQVKFAGHAAMRQMLDDSPTQQVMYVEAILKRRIANERAFHAVGSRGVFEADCCQVLRKFMLMLLGRNLPYSSEEAAKLITLLAVIIKTGTRDFDSELPAVLNVCEKLKSHAAISPELKQALEHLKASLSMEGHWEGADRKRVKGTIDSLIAIEQPALLDPGEAWGNAAMEDLKRVLVEESKAWAVLLEHCHRATSSKPSQKWTKTAQEMVSTVGRKKFKEYIVRWFELVALPRPIHRDPGSQWDPDPDLLITDRNSLILKGLAWCCAGWKDSEISRALGNLAEVCFKKVRMLGSRCPRVGNACLFSLGSTGSSDAAAQLSRLDQTVKQPTAEKFIGKSLNHAAELTGQTREDLEESTVPDYGLDDDGRLAQKVGNFAVELCVSGSADIELSWRNADGKLQKSIPTEVKERHADAFKKFKRLIRDIETMLPAQRFRIERLFMSEREWSLGQWRERYLCHRLLTHLTRRLIWHFKLGDRTALGIWRNGKIVDVNDRPIDWLAPETSVRLWHPIGFSLETVVAWRRWLESHEVTQPFKQAHREIYILTDAEQQTETYSNRFAAHILRQPQFAALARERGWKYSLQGAFDSHNTPTLLLPRWNLTAEFWVNPPGGNEATAETGIYLYVSTDQVRFNDPKEPHPLVEIPALVFSEVMRDVDLFVGVCSLGNDLEWRDAGTANAAYWHTFSFGDLSATANTRREVLKSLLPRLNISSLCELRDKFLVVQGSLRTYKIHLGSGNILMEPNDQYLCIVPEPGFDLDRSIRLPFEGDRTLSVILSKAFLLADDSKIKDPTILRQINLKDSTADGRLLAISVF